MLRRSLLTSAIAASLLTTFSLPAFATQVYETDLVIIGGGLSGLAAAQSAVDQGAKPIVLEKEAALGGGGRARHQGVDRLPGRGRPVPGMFALHLPALPLRSLEVGKGAAPFVSFPN